MKCPSCKRPIAAANRVAKGRNWTLYEGNSIELLRDLAPGSVDAIITDPPYGSGGDTAASRTRSSKSKYVSSGATYQSTLPDMAGDSLLPEAWAEDVRQWFAAGTKTLRTGGVFLVFIDWRNLYAIHSAAMRAGLTPRGAVIWNKGRGSRPYKGGFRRQAEFVYWATKGAPRQWEGAPYLDGVLNYSTIAGGKVHITQKPLGLMAELVSVCAPGSLIVDPFAGSGTTGVAALQAGHQFIGYEAVAEYFDTARARLNAAKRKP